MREYPPTHPGVALRTVMGPQSVVHTWAERADDLRTMNIAERALLHEFQHAHSADVGNESHTP